MPAGGRPLPPGAGPGQADLIGLRKELEEDISRIEGENGEIDMLMEQVLVEIERHQGRRTKMESQLATAETSGSADAAELAELRDGLLALTRREMLFDAQRQVLEGKQRVLARFLQRLVEIDNSLAAMGAGPTRPAPVASVGLRALAEASGGSGGPGFNQPAMAMRSQEDLRRDIVRQLHDGPAQSIANIGLQAEIVERLVQKDDPRAISEVESLRRLVQQALDTTKEFIFEIRPMVLDDLGLGPTIRRTASDRGRRADINVEYVAQGIEERLDRDVESAIYRSVDEAIEGYLELRPPSVLVRIDWGQREVVATVEGTWPRINPEGQTEASDMAASRTVETPPALLAMMEEKRSAERAADRAARSLPAEMVRAIEVRARALGLTLTMRDDGQVMELVAPVRR
ncbi:MAG: histidine kinase [Chloroflexota bacterium]|jgi:two-component system sensor histidine kinase DegS